MTDFQSWDELRTAYYVAQAGTVSGAAAQLGVHHATVIRHVDALETRLGSKLFQRHPRGYTATEAGRDLLQVAKASEDQFNQLARRIKGRGATVSGELIVTSVAALSPIITPVLAEYAALHPEVSIRFLTESRLFRLEYGEAHVALRAGRQIDQPDNVDQPFFEMEIALYASNGYHEKYGSMRDGAYDNHRFVFEEGASEGAPFYRWAAQNIPNHCITYKASDQRAVQDAIHAGAGIGFLSVSQAGKQQDLVQMLPPRAAWNSHLRLVTHVDLHRTAKVQSILAFLKKNREFMRTGDTSRIS